MKLARLFAGPLSAVLLSGTVMAQAPQGEIDAHVAAACAAAGLDSATHSSICAQPARRPAARGRGAGGRLPAPDRATWYAPPVKVFDNLYWLGTRRHSSWAQQTRAGRCRFSAT